MQDNNINPEEESPLQGQPHSDNPEKKEPEETKPENSSEPDSKSDENIKEKSDLVRQKLKVSNYQISLIDENLLKVIVQTKRGVKINSTVKEQRTLTETQSNEIYFYPKFDFSPQEVEIMISIDDDIKHDEEEFNITDDPGDVTIKTASEEKQVSDSNYQINLINENLLKVKIITGNGVRIDSLSRDKKTSIQSQSNRIYLQPKTKDELQEVEITIAIDTEKQDFKEELSGTTEDGKVKLIPNPEVIDLINQPDYSKLIAGDEDYTGSDTGYQNPFDSLRKLIRKNVVIGITAAVILHFTAAAVAYYTIGKSKDKVSEEPLRLIVLQDLPDPKIKLEDVEDPNKPPVQETPPEDVKTPEREITPRKIIRPPVVSRPDRDKEEEEKKNEDTSLVSSDLTRELDSLRKLAEQEIALMDSASSSVDTTKSGFEIPDSLRNSFTENDIGLAMYFPKSWKLTDQREINKSETEFKGVVLTDTTAEQPGTMNLFIFLDSAGKDFRGEDFTTEFEMNDSTLSAFSMEPKTLAGYTGYRFYIFNSLGTEKLSINAQVKKQFFDQYKNEIEAVVRSIRIKRKEDL